MKYSILLTKILLYTSSVYLEPIIWVIENQNVQSSKNVYRNKMYMQNVLTVW